MPKARIRSPRRTRQQVTAELQRLTVPERSAAESRRPAAPEQPQAAGRDTPDDAAIRRVIEAAYT